MIDPWVIFGWSLSWTNCSESSSRRESLYTEIFRKTKFRHKNTSGEIDFPGPPVNVAFCRYRIKKHWTDFDEPARSGAWALLAFRDSIKAYTSKSDEAWINSQGLLGGGHYSIKRGKSFFLAFAPRARGFANLSKEAANSIAIISPLRAGVTYEIGNW